MLSFLFPSFMGLTVAWLILLGRKKYTFTSSVKTFFYLLFARANREFLYKNLNFLHDIIVSMLQYIIYTFSKIYFEFSTTRESTFVFSLFFLDVEIFSQILGFSHLSRLQSVLYKLKVQFFVCYQIMHTSSFLKQNCKKWKLIESLPQTQIFATWWCKPWRF